MAQGGWNLPPDTWVVSSSFSEPRLLAPSTAPLLTSQLSRHLEKKKNHSIWILKTLLKNVKLQSYATDWPVLTAGRPL